MREGHYLHMQEPAAKANAEITCTQNQSSTCVLIQQPVDAS